MLDKLPQRLVFHTLYFFNDKKSIAMQGICMHKKNNCPGPQSILEPNQSDLTKYVAKMRDAKMPINAKMVQLEAERINYNYCDRSNHAKILIVECF